jgi:hypothetical protein
MVDENCSHLVPLAIEETLVLANETSDWGLQLIYGYALTRLGPCS